ncbi:hypothetical protein BGZ65_007171, partial [Modicella reniformis]
MLCRINDYDTVTYEDSTPAPPCQRISEIEKRANTSSQLTAMTAKAGNIHGDEVIVTTTAS